MKNILLLILTICSFASRGQAQITWSAPVIITTANVTEPQVTIDTSGNVTAIWAENGLIKASSMPSGGSFSTPVTISDILQTSSNPRLKIDSSGTATAMWIGNSQVQTSTRILGALWIGGILPISSSGATNLRFDMDSSGNAVAVWARNNFIESSTRKLGSWSAASVRSATNSSNPDVAISNSGKAVAVWHSVVSSSDFIVTNFLTVNTNTWGTTKNVFNATAPYQHNYPRVAIDANGNANVAWFRYNFRANAYTNVNLLTSSFPLASSTWSIPTILSTGGARNPSDLVLRLKFDLNGNLIALWTNSTDGESFDVESSRQLYGGSWQSALTLQSATIYSLGMDLAVASRMALMTNMSWDGSSAITIQSQETDVSNPFNTRWADSNLISTGNNNAYPRCALSINGNTYNAAAVWLNFDGTNTTLQAATGNGPQVISPSNVQATQSLNNFGAYQDYYNTLTWAPSSDPKLTQYSIYRNGILFASADLNTLQIIDHNQIQSGTVTYGVSALTSDYIQSPIVTFTLFP